jgi:chemotaxis protein MotB
MARKKKHPEHVNHERWLVSYADFITLLFAFFVVMFSASNADKQKAGQIATAMESAFHELAIFTPSGKTVNLMDDGGIASPKPSIAGNPNTTVSSVQIAQGTDQGGAGGSSMREAKAALQNALQEEVQAGAVRIHHDGRGLIVSLAEAGFFDPGSAVMRVTATEVLNRIAEKIQPLNAHIRVEGHTDNMPIKTAQFPSNWELSTARATNVLQHLLARAEFKPDYLSAVGFGEYRPVAPNDTAHGRAANRRVDLVVLGTEASIFEP